MQPFIYNQWMIIILFYTGYKSLYATRKMLASCLRKYVHPFIMGKCVGVRKSTSHIQVQVKY